MLPSLARRLLPALLLLIAALPVFAGAEPPACGDFLAEIKAKPKHLEFLECRPDRKFGLRVLQARYRVAGEHAAEVEEYLARTSGMGRLKRNCCGWENRPETPDDAHNGSLPHNRPVGPDGPTEEALSISMTSGETLEGRTRERWGEIPWFHVDVVMYLESP